MASFCENCGAQLGDGVLFCASCGTKVEDQAAESPVVPPPPLQTPPPAQPEYGQPAQPEYGQQPAQYSGQAPEPQYGGQAPPYVGQAPQGPYPAQKKKFPKWLLIVLIVIVAIIVGAIILLKAAGGIIGNYESKDFFNIGKDEVPSVQFVLGEERTISGVNSSVSNGVEKLVIDYQVEENQNSDMLKYAEALINDYGFINTTDYNFNGSRGRGFEFAKESVDEGFIVMVIIDYDTSGYTLTLTLVTGELTYNEPQEEEPVDDVVEEEEEEEPEEEPPVEPVSPAYTVEIIMPQLFLWDATDDIVQEDAEAYGYEAVKNPDGSYTFRMTEEIQQTLLEDEEQYLLLMMQMFLNADEIENILYTDDFSEIDIVCTSDDPEDEDDVIVSAIFIFGMYAPIYQIYQGYGDSASTLISLVDGNTDEVFGTYLSPDFLYDF